MSDFNLTLKNKSFRQLDVKDVAPNLLIREYYAEKGDTHEFVLSRDMTQDDMAHIVAYTEGSVEVSRSDSPEVIRRVETAGNTSNEYVWETALRGKTIHRVITDTYRYYCITDQLFRKMQSKTIRFDELQSQQVSSGVLVFVAMGAVTVNGTQLNAPALFISPTSEDATTLHGEPGTLVLEIEKLD
tara:strand:- start:963 stop:1520 length:558 start_codon:yes stop_codon:yes gene_type:complete